MKIEFKRTLLFLCACIFIIVLHAQIPKTGTYTYTVVFTEWNGKSHDARCTVVIKGDSIWVIHNGSANLTGKKGDILDQGIIMKHKKTGSYIIAHDASDADSDDANGCEGPSVIDFKRKVFWIC
jgi:hypothetical protein